MWKASNFNRLLLLYPSRPSNYEFLSPNLTRPLLSYIVDRSPFFPPPFFLGNFCHFCKSRRGREEGFSGDGDFSGFSASFSFLAILFAVESRGVARSMVFRRPLISHEASPFTATGQVNRICDEAIDEASDELLLEK